MNRVEVEAGAHLVDEDLGLHLVLAPTPGCTLWTYPLYTVSSSERGFERTFQGVGVLLGFKLRAGERNAVRLDLELV